MKNTSDASAWELQPTWQKPRESQSIGLMELARKAVLWEETEIFFWHYLHHTRLMAIIKRVDSLPAYHVCNCEIKEGKTHGVLFTGNTYTECLKWCLNQPERPIAERSE